MRAETADGGVIVLLEDDERELLRRLTHEMKTLLEADISRDDEVVQRLFPDAYEDPEDAMAYRELVGSQLSDVKLEALSSVRAALDEPTIGPLSEEDTTAWLSVLTDLRLAIGVRLEVTEETMETETDPGHPDAAAYSVLHWLGWVQESVLRELYSQEA